VPPARVNPVNLINLESVRKAFGTRTLLDGVSLGIAAGERVGVVGRNGDGKTTLLEVLTRRTEPDDGRITHVGGLRLGAVTQHDTLDPRSTVRQLVLSGRETHEWAGDARIRDILTGLFGGLDLPGFAQGLDTAVGPLSGGERRRIALARTLVDEVDLLVLDEPTNHLDVEGIDWLARHLVARRSALVVVTHDRWFLDAVCTRTWEVGEGQVREYDGGYSAYVLARAERSRIAAAEESRRQNLLRKELAWLRRGPPARTSKPRFRIDAANALIADEPPPRDDVELMQFASARLGRTVFDLHDVSLRVGDKQLLDRVTWQVGPGDRIGVVGVNGSGKTSLLRLLLGEAAPTAGKVVTGVTVKPAYLSQEVRELPGTLRVLEAVEEIAREVEIGKGRTLSASQLCERFGFTGDRQWTRVAELSGGERRRLQLLRLLMGGPNVLVLDEPTNDLDIDTLTALEDLLDGWPGSLLVVSHDRYFVERVCSDVVALLGDGQLRGLPGGIEEYVALRAQADAAEPAAPAARPGATPTAPAAAQTGGSSPGGGGRARAARKDLQRIERRLAKVADQQAALHQQMEAASTDYVRMGELDEALRELVAEQAELEDAWLEAAEAVHE
jgi:ATP-binding cassette subfamily F protein uup